jgi:hypothetical protein
LDLLCVEEVGNQSGAVEGLFTKESIENIAG